MRHRRSLLCTLTFASRHALLVGAAFLCPSSQARFSTKMHHQLFKISRSRLLSLSTRALFAASGTVHLSKQQQGWESRPSRWTSASPWRSLIHDEGRRAVTGQAVSMSARGIASSTRGSSTRAPGSAPLEFRRGTTTDGESYYQISLVLACAGRVFGVVAFVVWCCIILEVLGELRSIA